MTMIPEFQYPARFQATQSPRENSELVRRFPSRPKQYSFEPSSRWVRGIIDDTAVVDSRTQFLIWEPEAKVPEYLFSREHVRTDLLVPSQTVPALGSFYRPQISTVEWFDVLIGQRRIEHAAWKWDVSGLEEYLTLNWFPGVFDAWYEEEELVHTHPRDPHNRVDAIPSTRHVQVFSHSGILLAESHNPVAVYETGLPVRYYLPPEHVSAEALEPVDQHTSCPYKGHTSRYWRVRVEAEPVAWMYAQPAPGLEAITQHIAFYQERVTLIVDGIVSETNELR